MTLQEKAESTFIKGLNISKREMSEEILGDIEVNPTVKKTAFIIPEISISVFASPEAKNILKTMGDREQEKQGHENDIGDNLENADCHKTRKCKRWQQAQKHFIKDQKSFALRRGPLSYRRRSEGGNSTLGLLSTDNLGKFSPVPPKSHSPRRTSLLLNPDRRVTSPSRNRVSSDSIMMGKETTFQNINSESHLGKLTRSSPLSSSSSSPPPSLTRPISPRSSSSLSCHANTSGENTIKSRLQSRRRYSLPVSHRIHITSLHPQKRGSSPPCSSTSTAGIATRSISPRPPVTRSLQMNREKLENLIKERSKVIANLTIRNSTEAILPHKSKEETPIRTSRRPSLTQSLSPPEVQSITSLETTSLLDTGRPVNAAPMASLEAHSTNSMKKAGLSQGSLSPTHLINQSSGLLIDDCCVTKSGKSSFITDRNHTILPSVNSGLSHPKSALGNRRRSAPTLAGDTQQVSSQCRGDTMKSITNRCDDEIENEIEVELQRRILLRKNQLLIQAAPGSWSRSSAVARLEARANSKTTNGRLRKIMNNLTMGRTTAQLLVMRQALVAS